MSRLRESMSSSMSPANSEPLPGGRFMAFGVSASSKLKT